MSGPNDSEKPTSNKEQHEMARLHAKMRNLQVALYVVLNLILWGVPVSLLLGSPEYAAGTITSLLFMGLYFFIVVYPTSNKTIGVWGKELWVLYKESTQVFFGLFKKGG